MSRKSDLRLEQMQSPSGYRMRADDGEPIKVKVDSKGTVSLSTRLSEDNGGIGEFEITGLTPQKAASKKKGFWRNLWSKIKDIAGAILDAVTVPIFGYRCRPDIDINLNRRSFALGFKCVEAG